MKLNKAMIVAGMLTVIAPVGWAQDNQGTATVAPAEQGHSDSIVRMRHQEAAANRAYQRKVAAAKKVYDEKKAEAKKERDAAIAAARYGSTQ
nr:hypothetical protein [Paraburkholderia humisilvae]